MDRKEYFRNYYRQNKQRIKDYSQKNQQKIQKYLKDYYRRNRQRMLEKRKPIPLICNFCHKSSVSFKKYQRFCSLSCSSRSRPSGAKGRKWGKQTEEHRNWQKNLWHHRRKSATGKHTFDEWNFLKAQYNWTCPGCYKREPEIKLTQDHIIPLSMGGSDNIENIQPLCKSCNCRKWTKLIKY